MKLGSMMILTGALVVGLSGAAYADACSGHNHTTGTVLGAAGGGIIGGAVLGGLAGNAVARSNDCDRHHRRHHSHYRHHPHDRAYDRHSDHDDHPYDQDR
jgi:hypothetical protein